MLESLKYYGPNYKVTRLYQKDIKIKSKRLVKKLENLAQEKYKIIRFLFGKHKKIASNENQWKHMNSFITKYFFHKCVETCVIPSLNSHSNIISCEMLNEEHCELYQILFVFV